MKEVCFESQISVQSKWIFYFDNSPNRGPGTFNRVLSAIVSSVLPNLPEELKRYLSFRLKHVLSMHGPWFSSSLFRDFLQAELSNGYGISEDKAEKIYSLILDSISKSKLYAGLPTALGTDSNWCHFCLFLYKFNPELFELSRSLGMGSILERSINSALHTTNSKTREFIGQSELKIQKVISEIRAHQIGCPWYLDKFWLSYLIALHRPQLYSSLTQDFLDQILALLGKVGLEESMVSKDFHLHISHSILNKEPYSSIESDDFVEFLLQVDLVFESNGAFFLTQDAKKLTSKFMMANSREDLTARFRQLPDTYQIEFLKMDCLSDAKELWTLRNHVRPSSVFAYLDALTKWMPEVTFGISIQQWLLESQTAKVVRAKIIEWIEANKLESICSETLLEFSANRGQNFEAKI